MNVEDENKVALIPSQPTALSRAGAASLASRGLNDLLESEFVDDWCQKGTESWNQHEHAAAMRWFRMAADKGDAKAMFSIGCLYDSGYGVATDHEEAMSWWRKAAEQGYARAHYMLGAAYYSGESVLQDKAEALRWFLKSAELGYTGAQYDLGSRYETGTGGVSKDEAEAVHWYRKAAEQGFAPAQLSLGMQYLYGEGVAKDDAEAYFWISLAALISTSNDEYITSKRDKAGTTLTPEKRLEIQERCREWVKAHPTVHGWAGIASAKRNPRLTTPR